MRDCYDTARIEITVVLSSILPELIRIYTKTRNDHKSHVQAEINKQLDHLKTVIIRSVRGE